MKMKRAWYQNFSNSSSRIKRWVTTCMCDLAELNVQLGPDEIKLIAKENFLKIIREKKVKEPWPNY